MPESTAALVLLDLTDPGEYSRLADALRGEGLEVASPPSAGEGERVARPEQWLDEEVRLSGADFVLVDSRLWKAAGFEVGRSITSYVVLVLADPEEKDSTAAFWNAGAFDAVFRGGEAWEEGVATYLRVLSVLWRRFSGALGTLERRFEDLVHALPDIVYELDESGRFTFVNNSVRLLGYEPQELAGRHFSFLLEPEDAENVDRDKVLEWFKGAVTGPALSPKLFNERRNLERRTENLELRLKRKQGKGEADDVLGTVISYGEVASVGDWRDGSRFRGSVGVIRDITLRRKSEDMLRKLYQAVDQLAAGVLVVDTEFRIEYANSAFLRMAGREPPEVIGSGLFPFFEIGEYKAAELASLVRQGFDAREELRLVDARGERIWTAFHASPVREPSGDVTHAILVCEDMSQTKAMADLLRAAKDEAERADRAKSDFLASMGHELKGPLTSVMAAARLIEMGHPEPVRKAQAIVAGAQGLLDLIGDILDFVRFDTEAPALRRLTFPLAGFVRKTCEPWIGRAAERGLEFEIPRLDEAVIVSDPDRLARAFSALLANAVGFTERGRIRVEASIESRSGNVPHLVLSVADTGIGIAPADQGRIFSPFVQLSSPYAKTAGGAGIGLSLARTIVRALGGEIRVASTPGAGSLFTILVPVGEPATETSPAGTKPAAGSWRILVVDDNEINRDYMGVLLENAGHRVEKAGTGAEALRLLEATEVDAAVLDIQMPGMSGIELGRKIRDYIGDRYDPALPLVALTAFGPEDVLGSTVDFDRVLSKPADIPLLLASIASAMERREAEAPGFHALRWGARPTAGAAALAKAEHELPELLGALAAAARNGDRERLREASISIAGRVALVGAVSLEAACRRIGRAAGAEDPEVLAARAERIGRRWERALAAAKSGVPKEAP